MGKINLLSFEVANLIAAGEVVDRPASAVKELLENAIDSEASQITLEIQRGGVSFIRVADNGCGMEKDDLKPAITRHSTSKISKAEDLGSIMTLGFRGEALAAIASVSRLRIFSRIPGSPMGAMLEAEGGRIESIRDTGCQEGTTVIVEDLFYNVPARRKFLKKDSTEAIAIGAVVEKIALSRPDISFKFISDGEIKFLTAGNGDLRQTIWALFGKDVSRRSLPVDREENGIRVTGFVSEPDLYRSNRNMENFFINGRYIKSKTAAAALEQAYSSKIPHEKFPFCVLNLELNPAAVDVNVHPAKLEVKFANEKIIFDAVYYAVLSALEAEAHRPELKLPGTPPAKKTAGTTASGFADAFLPMDKRNGKGQQIRLSELNAISAAPTDEELLRTHRQAAENLRRASEYVAFPTGSSLRQEAEKPHPAAQEIPIPADRPPVHERSAPADVPTPKPIPTPPVPTRSEPIPAPEEHAPTPPLSVPAPEPAIERTVSQPDIPEIPAPNSVSQSTQGLPPAAYCPTIDPAEIPEYVIIGEAFHCYVIVQIEDRILMVDKHAAHERILFDELCRKMQAHLSEKSASNGQLLMAPIEVDLLSDEADALTDYEDKIQGLGFAYTFEKIGVSSYRAKISQIPDTLDTAASIELFTTLASKLSDATATVESAAEGFFESRLWQASCKAAIKGGRIYDIAHIKWICDRLLKKPGKDNSVIRTCPHGRPVAFEIKKSSIDRQFARLM